MQATEGRKSGASSGFLMMVSSIHLPLRMRARFHDLLTVFLKPMAMGRRLGLRHPSNGKQLPAVLINLAE
jgi:hypothetical protein